MIGRLSPRRRRAAPQAADAEPIALAPEAAAVPLRQAAEPATAVHVAAGIPASHAEVAPGTHAAHVGPTPYPLVAHPAGVGPDGPAALFAPQGEEAVAVPDPSAPAGLAVPAVTDGTPGFRSRGRLRRRLRYLRQARELGFRDLGGLMFDLHRFGRDGAALVEDKLAALGAVDAELRALADALDDRRPYVDLREPGIAACPRCSALHGSDARFCPNCGLHIDGPLALTQVAPTGAAGSEALGPAAPGSPAGRPERSEGLRADDAASHPVASGRGPVAAPPATQATGAGPPAAARPPEPSSGPA